MRNFILFCALASVAYSRPGETSTQIQQRFGAPLTKKVSVDPGAHKVVGGVSVASGSRIKIGNARQKNEEQVVPVVAPPLSVSMRETSAVYSFGGMKITVRYFDNRSQREEYKKDHSTKGLEAAEVEQILTAASNGAAWDTELHEKDPTDPKSTKETVFQDGKKAYGNYKTPALRAWMEGSTLILETKAFRQFWLAQPAAKPEPGKPIPSQGKGF